MVWRPTVYSLPPLVAALVAAVLAWEGWRHREEPVSPPFVTLMAAVWGWSLCYAVQLGFTTRGDQLFWQTLGTSFGATIPVSWLVLALVYAGHERWLTRRRVLGLALEPAAAVLLLWTNPLHGLMWSRVGFQVGTAVPVIELAFGPAYLAHVAFAYLLVVAGIALLVGVVLRASPVYRRQAALLVVGAAVPLGANVAFTLGLDPVPELDLTSFAFTFTGTVFGLALFRLDFLNLRPVARERLIEVLGSGLLVVDADDRVVHFNDVARTVLPGLRRVGQDATALLSVERVADLDGRLSAVEVDGTRRFYDFRVTGLRDYRDRLVGQAVGMREVTERREYEQRLEVANRLLRHNLRNDMNKIIGWAEMIEATADGDAADRAGRIRAVARDVADLSRRARRIEASLEADGADRTAVEVAGLLEEVVAEARSEWPDADLAVEAPEAATVAAPGRDLLATALRNVVENALEHNDADRPRIEVTAARADGTVEVRVADDGPGIPEMERQTLLRGGETSLQHGSGLGLWLVHWIVTAAGGDLAFEENDPRGSVVILRLEADDDADPRPTTDP